MCYFLKFRRFWWIVFFTNGACFLSLNLFVFYLMFEVSLIPIFLILIFWGNQPERLNACLSFILYTVVFSLPFIIFVLWFLRGKFIIFSAISVRNTLLGFSLLPFFVKLPVFGLHYWLPKAHVEASTRGSMILAGLLLKLGGFGVIRLRRFIFIKRLSLVFIFLLALVSSLVTCRQSDIKKLIAYSRVTHITFIVLALLRSLVKGVVRVIILSLAHGWASSGIFLVGGTKRRASKSRLLMVMSSERKFHFFLLLFGFLLILNSSIPPMPSFFPELFLIMILRWRGVSVFGFLILSLLVCYYNVFLYLSICQRKNMTMLTGALEIKTRLIIFFRAVIRLETLFWLLVA